MKSRKLLGLGAALFVAALVSSIYPPSVALADDARVIVVAKAAVDLASQADGVGAETTVTVPRAALGDACIASFGVDVAGMSVTCYISAANTVKVRTQNESAGAVDLASTTLRVFVFPKGTK